MTMIMQQGRTIDYEATYQFIANHEFFTSFGVEAQQKYLVTML